eukprot:scaffold13136_cov30-Tisochrysis_lutea.AAC.6
MTLPPRPWPLVGVWSSAGKQRLQASATEEVVCLHLVPLVWLEGDEGIRTSNEGKRSQKNVAVNTTNKLRTWWNNSRNKSRIIMWL